MHKKKISFDLSVFQSHEELDADLQELLLAAEKSRANAYAPYSNFMVGAAVLLGNDEIVIGNNQENASYPSGLCAERVAVFQAGARFPDTPIKAIAISSGSHKFRVDKPAAPCGNCRQAIAEYELKQESPITLVISGEEGPVYKIDSIADILPLAFGNSYLK